MKELSVGEQRYKAVMAVLSGGRTVTEVARDWDVAGKRCLRGWLATSERARGAGLGDAALQAVLGPASAGPGVGQERRDPNAVGLRDLSLPAPGGPDSAGPPAVATRGLETLGAGRGDGAVAVGCGRRVSSRPWHHGQGPDWAGRPLVHGRGLLEPLRMLNSGRDLTPVRPRLCASAFDQFVGCADRDSHRLRLCRLGHAHRQYAVLEMSGDAR